MRSTVLTLVGGALLGASLTLAGISLTNRIQEDIKEVTTPATTDTVYMRPEVIDHVIREAVDPPKPSVIERLTTKEVVPDTVYIAKTDSITPPENIPDYGIQQVKKDDKLLVVTSLKKDGTEVQKTVYSLPNDDSDYLLTSGTRAATLRADRTWDVVSLGAELLVVAGAGGVAGVAIGPVSVNVTPHLQVSPAVMLDAAGTSVGVAIQLEF